MVYSKNCHLSKFHIIWCSWCQINLEALYARNVDGSDIFDVIFDGATTAADHESGASAPQLDVRVRATRGRFNSRRSNTTPGQIDFWSIMHSRMTAK